MHKLSPGAIQTFFSSSPPCFVHYFLDITENYGRNSIGSERTSPVSSLVNRKVSRFSCLFVCFFKQDNQVGDDRGAQDSHPDSTYPQWSSVSSSSSKSSFRPSSSSASGGVFGSTARNDRTSALKAAFQVFIFHPPLS